MKQHHWLERAIFFCLLSLSLPGMISLLFPQLSGSSQIELRQLQDLPPLPRTPRALYQWPGRFDQFAVDRFPFRSQFIQTSGRLFYHMGISISPDVVIGPTGWLFLERDSDVLDESRGVLTLSELQIHQWVEQYQARKDELQTQGIDLIFVIVPNKHTLYPQHLGELYFQVGETISDQLVRELTRADVDGIIDLRPSLKTPAVQEQIYRQFDTHWDDRGAYYGYREILKHIPTAYLIPPSQVRFQQISQGGDLSRMIGHTTLVEPVAQAEVLTSHVIERDWKARDLDLGQEWVSRTDLREAPRAIFISDSFTLEYMYKFLEHSFQESVFIHHRDFINNIDMTFRRDLIAQYQPDLVFYIIVERSIPHTLLND